MSRSSSTRREFLYATSATVGTAALAGCSGGDDGSGDGNGDGGGDVPQAIDDYLQGAQEYNGSIQDATGQDEVTVEVGGGTGLAFTPPAVRVDSGTTVVWEWTGQGGAHNVESAGDSDFEFRSGDAVDSDSETFEQTFDEAGTALYFCDPHEAAGMKGGVEVVE